MSPSSSSTPFTLSGSRVSRLRKPPSPPGTPFTLSGSRIANASRVWQAAEDSPISNWDKTKDFIVAIASESAAHATADGTLQIYWRNKTDGGSFVPLGNTGELTYNGVTNLVNDNPVTTDEKGCTSGLATFVDGIEREGANDCVTSLGRDEWTEHQWAIDASNALDGKEYEFQLYDLTEGASVGTCLATLTTLGIPAPPTNVSATKGDYADKVTITWTKSSGATGYQVYRDGVGLGWLGDVATYDDSGADAPTITPGAAAASDGIYTTKVVLSLSGQLAKGTTHTYKVRAKNILGESGDSETDTGYREIANLTYQWQRSSADSDADYSDISGATTISYDDIDAPADGSGRYYRCVVSAIGATQQNSSPDRGYRDIGAPAHGTYHGTITNTGGENCDYRGFVWDNVSHGDPGNIAPAASAYAPNYWIEGNSYGAVSFSHQVTELAENDTFYVRACAHNSAGWSYGNEVSFDTLVGFAHSFGVIIG